MLYRFFNEFDEHTLPALGKCDYGIQMHCGKFGIVSVGEPPQKSLDGVPVKMPPTLKWVVMAEYDNIFRCGENEFVLCNRGKVGAVRFAGDMPDTPKQIAPCEYDSVDISPGAFIFSKPGERRYYSRHSYRVAAFSHVVFVGPENRYLFAVGAGAYYIIECATDTVLWFCEKDDSEKLWVDEPCFVYMGEKDGLPTFFDCTNGNYLLPYGENKLDFAPDFPNNIITPIIVQGKNIVNIIDDAGKVNAGSYEECVQKDFNKSGGFDEVTVEIKVTLKSQACTVERLYPIPIGTFAPGDMVDFDQW